MTITGAVATNEYKVLELYHCVSYSEMDSEIKNMLFRATIENVCNVDEFPEITLTKPSDQIQHQLVVEHNEKPLLKRLFGSRI